MSSVVLALKVCWDLILVMGLEAIGRRRVGFEDNVESPCEKTISDEDTARSSCKRKISLQTQERGCFPQPGFHPIQIL